MKLKYHEKIALPHAVYRLFDRTGKLLYLGCSFKLLDRISSHLAVQPWFRDIEHITLKWYPDWLTARQREMKAIIEEKPLYNRLIHNPDGVGRSTRQYIADCVPAARLDGYTCPKCGGPKPHKKGLAYCRPCMKKYQEERRRIAGVKPPRPPTTTCPKCKGEKPAGPSYCKPCRDKVNAEYRLKKNTVNPLLT